MRIQQRRHLAGASRRGSFTLVELLVVLAIIAALLALTASAVMKYLGSQQQANTKATLDRTQSALNKAWSAVKDQAYKEAMTAPAYIPGTIPPQPAGMTVGQWIQQNLAGNDANATGRTRVIYVKLRLRQAFPMNFNEALYPAPLPQLPAYVTYLKKLGITGSTPATLPYESAACLLMALQRGQSGGGVNPSDLMAGGSAGSFSVPGGNLSYLVDAWGTPVYFARFPTGSTVLNPNGAQPGNNDPLDPLGYLQTPKWGTTYGPLFQALTLQQLAPGNTSYKLAPMIASAGMDKEWQTNPITFAPITLDSDDLFSTP